MEEYIFRAIEKYFRTLTLTGTVKESDKFKLFLVDGLYHIIKVFRPYITEDDIKYINDYIDCLSNNNCLFDNIIPCFNHRRDSLITIREGDVITSLDNEIVITSIQRKTQNFTNFEVRTEIQSDDYVVGYDSIDNKEVAINVNDLGIFWS